MEEIWEKIIIDNKETFYSVSNYGRIRNDSTGTFLEGLISNNGYRMVHLRYRIDKNCSVHRLVMKAFFPCEDMDELQINHKDGNKLNNRIDNLEWNTALENMRHSFRTGLQRYSLIPCYRYDLDGNYIDSFESCSDAARMLNIDRNNIYRCISEQQTHYQKWQFKSYKQNRISKWHNPNENYTYVYTDDGEFVEIYESQQKAAEAFGVSKSSICRYINGTRKMRGFIFSKRPL